MKKVMLMSLFLLLIFTSLAPNETLSESHVVVYFKETTCEVCAAFQGYMDGVGEGYDVSMDYVKKMEDQGITVIIYDIMENPVVPEYNYVDADGNEVEVTALDVFAAFNTSYGRTISTVPVVFAGDQYFDGLENLRQAIDNGTIYEKSASPLIEVNVEKGQAYQELTGFFGFLLVLGAGLLDGFNPCAIALLLLFISLLGFSDNKKRLILVSFVYISALFLSYFLIGAFLLEVLQKFSAELAVIGTIINWFVLFLVFFLFLFNMYDFIQARNERYGKIKNQLPKWIQRYNKKIVQSFTSLINGDQNKGLFGVLILTFTLGILLSITELVCTGQIYFGILYGIHTMQSAYAYILLLFYNLMFVLPLIVIAVVSVRLKSTFSVSNWVREHLPTIKLLNALLFFIIFLYFFNRLFHIL
jgi:cytochrome c biogenesis protein CcdA